MSHTEKHSVRWIEPELLHPRENCQQAVRRCLSNYKAWTVQGLQQETGFCRPAISTVVMQLDRAGEVIVGRLRGSGGRNAYVLKGATNGKAKGKRRG